MRQRDEEGGRGGVFGGVRVWALFERGGFVVASLALGFGPVVASPTGC